MRSIGAVVRKEFSVAFKDRVFLIIAVLFLIMSAASVYIGSTTKNAEMRAYQEIVAIAQANGDAVPQAPEIYPLAILRNMIDYVVMIGAVLAIFLGFDAFGFERESGTLRLALTRPISRSGFVLGKWLGAGSVIGVLLMLTLVFNIVLFALTTGLMPEASEISRLIAFFLLAFFYMFMFYSGSLLVSIRAKDRTYGFLLMMVIWVFISFVIPQLAESQRNFAFAVSDASGAVAQIPVDTPVSRAIELFSPPVQFRLLGGDLLQTVSGTAKLGVLEVLSLHFIQVLYAFVPSGILLLLSFSAVKMEDAI